MKPPRTLLLALLASTGLLSAGTTDKDAKSVTLAPAEAWGYPLLGGGVKTSDVYVEGSFFLTLPLHSTIGLDGTLGGDYFFVEPYTSWGEQGEVASSLGFGWRHLFNGQPVSKLKDSAPAGFMDEGWYLGASLFVDRLDTQFDNVFWQMGIGAEIGTRYLELRGNYYIPFNGDRKLAFKDVQTQTVTSTSTQLVQSGGGAAGTTFAQGNSVFQNTGGTVTEVTTTSTTTLTRTTSIFEEGMEGWDAELALLVPWVDQWCDVKLIGGYFAFDNQPFGPQTGSTGNVEGWKAGLEVRPVPAVALHAMWYDDERFTGSDWTVGVRFEIPLGREWKDAFTPRRRHLVERMAEPVHRQNAAVKIGNSSEEETESQTTTAVTRRVVSQGNGVITIAEDVIFVNNGPASGDGIAQADPVTQTGTAEQPFDTVQKGADAATTNSTNTGRTWTAYVQGGGATYTEDVSLANTGNVNFVASGPRGGFTGQSGQVFGAGSATPVISGGIQTDVVDTVGVRGFTIEDGHGGQDLLRIENFGSFTATNNLLRNAGDDAILVGGESVVGTAVISNNTADNIADDFLDVQLGNASVVDMTVSGNTVTNVGDMAVEFDASFTSQVSFNFLNNTINTTGDDGLNLVVSGSADMDTTISGNTLLNIGGSGVAFTTGGAGTSMDAILNGNTLTTLGNHGFAFFAGENNTLQVNGTVNNTVTGETNDKLNKLGGTVNGTIILNGVPVPSDVTVP